MTQRVIACTGCKHFHRKSIKETGVPRCDAFPEGIPLIIQQGRMTHRLPMAGDRGIQYEPREGRPDILRDFPPPESEPFPVTDLGN